MHDSEFRQPRLRPIYSISPSEENDKIYGSVDTTDDAFLALVDSIQKNGLLQPIEVTSDGYIISGHRRYVACKDEISKIWSPFPPPPVSNTR